LSTRVDDSPNISGFSKRHFLSILKESEKRLQLRVGNLIHEKTDELLKRQTNRSPSITLLEKEVVSFGDRYDARDKETTGEFAENLAGPVGQLKGFGKQQRRWVTSKVREFYRGKKTVEAGEYLFYEAFLRFFTQERDSRFAVERF